MSEGSKLSQKLNNVLIFEVDGRTVRWAGAGSQEEVLRRGEPKDYFLKAVEERLKIRVYYSGQDVTEDARKMYENPAASGFKSIRWVGLKK